MDTHMESERLIYLFDGNESSAFAMYLLGSHYYSNVIPVEQEVNGRADVYKTYNWNTRCAIYEKKEHVEIGTVCLEKRIEYEQQAVEIYIEIQEVYRRQGYAYEALSYLIRQIIFATKIRHYCTFVRKDNDIGIALLNKLGFEAERGIRINRGKEKLFLLSALDIAKQDAQRRWKDHSWLERDVLEKINLMGTILPKNMAAILVYDSPRGNSKYNLRIFIVHKNMAGQPEVGIRFFISTRGTKNKDISIIVPISKMLPFLETAEMASKVDDPFMAYYKYAELNNRGKYGGTTDYTAFLIELCDAYEKEKNRVPTKNQSVQFTNGMFFEETVATHTAKKHDTTNRSNPYNPVRMYTIITLDYHPRTVDGKSAKKPWWIRFCASKQKQIEDEFREGDENFWEYCYEDEIVDYLLTGDELHKMGQAICDAIMQWKPDD